MLRSVAWIADGISGDLKQTLHALSPDNEVVATALEVSLVIMRILFLAGSTW